MSKNAEQSVQGVSGGNVIEEVNRIESTSVWIHSLSYFLSIEASYDTILASRLNIYSSWLLDPEWPRNYTFATSCHWMLMRSPKIAERSSWHSIPLDIEEDDFCEVIEWFRAVVRRLWSLQSLRAKILGPCWRCVGNDFTKVSLLMRGCRLWFLEKNYVVQYKPLVIGHDITPKAPVEPLLNATDIGSVLPWNSDPWESTRHQQ